MGEDAEPSGYALHFLQVRRGRQCLWSKLVIEMI